MNPSKACPHIHAQNNIMAESPYNPRIIRSQRYRPRNSPAANVYELSAPVETTASKDSKNDSPNLGDIVPRNYQSRPRKIIIDADVVPPSLA
jgi:hypothetical protein